MTGRAPERDPGQRDVEDVVDELLGIPPQQFTEARNAAAKRIREEGRREAADEIKRLPRPPLSLWALNRLAHEQPSLIETFLSAADELRQAHQSGGDIRAAMPPLRGAEARVVAAAGELARAHGMNVTETVMRALRETLSAATAGAEVATALREGRLIREPEAPSIDAILASLPRASTAARKKQSPRRDREAEILSLREEIADARTEASRARHEARAASDSANAAQREWERMQKLAERAHQTSDTAEERLRDLRERLAEITLRSATS
jgi:hypothetical protein